MKATSATQSIQVVVVLAISASSAPGSGSEVQRKVRVHGEVGRWGGGLGHMREVVGVVGGYKEEILTVSWM